MLKKRLLLITVFLLTLALTATHAQNESPFILQRSLFSAAGLVTTDDAPTLQLRGSLGEAIVSPVVTTTAYGLGSGFWAVGVVTTPPKTYLPVMFRTVGGD